MDEDGGVICERTASIGIGIGRVAKVRWIDGFGGVIGGGDGNIGPRLRRIWFITCSFLASSSRGRPGQCLNCLNFLDLTF